MSSSNWYGPSRAFLSPGVSLSLTSPRDSLPGSLPHVPFSPSLFHQVRSVKHMHSKRFIHGDLKVCPPSPYQAAI